MLKVVLGRGMLGLVAVFFVNPVDVGVEDAVLNALDETATELLQASLKLNIQARSSDKKRKGGTAKHLKAEHQRHRSIRQLQ